MDTTSENLLHSRLLVVHFKARWIGPQVDEREPRREELVGSEEPAELLAHLVGRQRVEKVVQVAHVLVDKIRVDLLPLASNDRIERARGHLLTLLHLLSGDLHCILVEIDGARSIVVLIGFVTSSAATRETWEISTLSHLTLSLVKYSTKTVYEY